MIRFALFIQVTSIAIIVLALLVLAGWQFGITEFTNILPGFVGMNPFTALGFMSIGCWELLYLRFARNRSGLIHTVMLTLAVFVLLVGGLRLLDLVTGTNYGFDNLVDISDLAYGFISPVTALSFSLLAIAMLLDRVLNRIHNFVLFLLTPVFLLSVCSLFGYMIANNDIFTLKPFKPMALHTTVCFLAHMICFLFLFPQNVFTSTVLSKDYGGFIARRLLPFIILVPLVLGFLSYQGNRWGFYDTGFGVAIVVVSAIYIFLAVVLHQSHQLSVLDQKRTAAEYKVHQHAQEVEVAYRHLEQRNIELEQFTYVSHHDLQEPLRKIIAFTDMVKADSYNRFTEESQKRFDRVLVSAHRMRDALRDVLEFAALNQEAQFEQVDLNELVQIVQDDLEMVIREKEAIIQSDQLPTIKAVPLQMHQLFYNLLNNALKFSKEGQPPVVTITSKKVTGTGWSQQQEKDPKKLYYEIAITDNGIGFEKEYAEKIFVLFQRLHSKDAYPGTGIGLALCKKVIQNHGGMIWTESKPGEGATFRMLLPAE